MPDALWRNVFGDEVNLDDIDRAYALNIYTMVVAKRARRGYTRDDFMGDPLVQKLREVILAGREPNLRDKLRGAAYSMRCWAAELPYRASR